MFQWNREEVDRSGVRMSYGEVITQVAPPYRASLLRKALNRAYLEVSAWDDSRLVRILTLSPLPHFASKY